MTERSHGTAAGPSHRSVEIGVARCDGAFGAVVIIGSLQVGIGWGAEGPKAGFFPFYVGLFDPDIERRQFGPHPSRTPSDRELFADWGQLRQVMSVVIPTTIYVALIPWLGIYVASILLIAAFMRWLGRYDWSRRGRDLARRAAA